ncbi:MAG TPA: sulfite exporter TauE/SafE family protein [Burkholderiales bacterium]
MPALVALVAGVVRGVTGFGGALVMTPPLALLLGPLVAVPVVLLLESVAAAPMLLETMPLVHWRVFAPLGLAACAAVPLGGYVLVSADPDMLRRAIAAIVIVFSLLLLRGWRYSGRQRPATSIVLGALSGAMLGATSVGAPPVILYLLSGPDRIETTRANLTLYLVVTSLAGLVMLWTRGVLDAAAAWTALWLAPGFYAGLVAGMRLFPYVSERRFRHLALLLLIAVSVGIVLA